MIINTLNNTNTMKEEDIKKAAKSNLKLNYRIGKTMCRGQKLEDFGVENFVDGADWRVNNSWHDPYNIPLNNEYLLLVENNSGLFGLCFEFSPENTKRWAYVKDLIPGKEE